MKSQLLSGVVAGAAALAAAATAHAAPATINLRVEGKSRTIFEGTVTTDVRTFKFTNDPTQHVCDGTSAVGGTSPVPAPTAAGALATLAETTPFDLTGVWYDGLGPSFDTVSGENTAYDNTTGTYLVEYYNGAGADPGACGQPVKTGDSYVFGIGVYQAPLLQLTGPTTLKPGQTVSVKAQDASNGNVVAGATVGGQTTGADGAAVLPAPGQRGVTSYKAEKAGSVRSNRIDVCVTDGADGYCGTTLPGQTTSPTAAPAAPAAVVPDTFAAFGKIASITEGKRFAKGAGPRVLAGAVDTEPAGIKDVRVRLSRTNAKACSYYDGVRERFVTTRRCGIKAARTFSVGTDASFSYLLPSALPKGRYVLDVVVLDRAKNQTTTYQRGRNRVVFVVG